MAVGEFTKEEAQRLIEESTKFLKKTVKTRKSPILEHIGFLNDVMVFLEEAKRQLPQAEPFGHCDSCGKVCDGTGVCSCGGPIAIDSRAAENSSMGEGMDNGALKP